ncbi:MAG: hypothetical protein KDD69_09725, partial [Bdellovibrionales bacterium]|nr:hypothetical protein [Bdellovibrionales bacterium]
MDPAEVPFIPADHAFNEQVVHACLPLLRENQLALYTFSQVSSTMDVAEQFVQDGAQDRFAQARVAVAGPLAP